MAQSFSMFYHVFLPIIIIAQDTILTNEYGNQNGNYFSTLDQGRISEINNWGVDFTGIHIRDWKSDLQTNYNEIYGYGKYHESCPSFNISTNDYIIGYKLYIDTTTYYEDEDEEETMTIDIIRGLVLYTLNGHSYSCIEDASVQSYTNIYSNYYLSGWNIYSQNILNSIQFQFTKINASKPSDSNDSLESMETNHDFDIIFFSSTANSQSESMEIPTQTKYAKNDNDSSDSNSPSSTSSSSQSAEDSQDDDNTSQDDDNDDSDDIEIEETKTNTVSTEDIQIDDDPNYSSTTTKVIHAVEQDNDQNEVEPKGSNQLGGTAIATATIGIVILTLMLCCVLTICVINIKRKKCQQEANQNQNVLENAHDNEKVNELDNDMNANGNDLRLTIPTKRVGERGSSGNLSAASNHIIKISVDGIDGLDENDTMLHDMNVVADNVRNIDICNLLSPRYGRRSTDDGSNSAWPINPIPRMNQGIPIKDGNNKRIKRRRGRPIPLDHPYSIDWTEPQMLRLTDKMANLFNEEDNKNGSFISTVKTGNNASRKPSHMTGISGNNSHGSETDDAETENDTDLMYNNMGPLNERKVTPQHTKGGDDDTESDEDEDEESQDDYIRNTPLAFHFVPRRNALKLLNVRSNTFGH